MLDLRIRQAERTDAAPISALSIDSAHAFILPDYNRLGRQTMLQGLSAQQIADNMQQGIGYWLAYSEDELVGVIGLKPPQHLYHFFVANAYMRRGIGRRLWQWLVQHRQLENVSVNASRYAVPFYQSLGFDSNPKSACFERNGVVCYPMIWHRQRDQSSPSLSGTNT